MYESMSFKSMRQLLKKRTRLLRKLLRDRRLDQVCHRIKQLHFGNNAVGHDAALICADIELWELQHGGKEDVTFYHDERQRRRRGYETPISTVKGLNSRKVKMNIPPDFKEKLNRWW